MAKKIWIRGNEAWELVRASDWAQSRRPAKEGGLVELFRFQVSIQDPEALKFSRFISLALDKFAECNSAAVRDGRKGKEYEEGALRTFLREAFDQDVKDEFGSIPDITVPD